LTQIHPHIADLPQAPAASVGHLLVSHDLRSALGHLVCAVQLLEDSALDGAAADHLAQVKVSARYMLELLDDAAGQPSETPVTDLAEAFAELERRWAGEAVQKGLSYQTECGNGLPDSLRMPRLDFLRVCNNVIGNAIKFASNGSIFLRAFCAGEDFQIEIVDEGPGFSDSALLKQFSLGGRPAENLESGSGIGLYIAHSLMEKAGGAIAVENREGGGAKVILRFPEDLQMKAAPPVRVEAGAIAGLPDLSHLRILLAEDNPTNQLVAVQMLKKMNARVQTASDGVEAMEQFRSGDYNLGLIDIEMPRKSGLEVMREIRGQAGAQAKVKLLALTAYVLPEHRERIMRAGADGIIAKPLTDISAFGRAILKHTGNAVPASRKPGTGAEMEMEIYNGLQEIIGHASMQELLEKVQKDLASVQNGIRDGVLAKEAAPIRANTHILISVAGAIGAVKLQHLAEKLNAQAKTSEWSDILPLAERCLNGISGVLEFVEQELDR